MKIYKTHQQAEIIYNIIANEIHDISSDNCEKFMDEIYVYPFHNGRENGYCFTVLNKIFVFVCENRNSDALTITVSTSSDWLGVTDKEYKKRIFFDYNEYYKVAKKVIDLLDFRKEVKK